MRMRNPLKSKRRQFLELQEDRGFTPGQFATPEPKSKTSLDCTNLPNLLMGRS